MSQPAAKAKAPLDPKAVRECLTVFLADARKHGQAVSQTEVARSLGCSPSMISAFMNDDYKGDVQKLCRHILAYLNEQERKAQASHLVLPYVETRQTQVALQCFELALAQHWMVAVISESGHGKSQAIKQFIKHHPGTILIEPWATTCPSGVMQDLCEAIGQSDRGVSRGLQKRIVHVLKHTDRLLIVDDAHDLGVKSMQVFRNVYDATGIGIALVGNSPLEARLAGTTPEMEQIARRVTYKRRLPSWTEADAEQQIHATLPHLDAKKVVGLFHPKAKQSPAWVAKTINFAGGLTDGQQLAHVSLEHLKEALEMVA